MSDLGYIDYDHLFSEESDNESELDEQKMLEESDSKISEFDEEKILEEDNLEEQTLDKYLDILYKKLNNGEIEDYAFALEQIMIKYKRTLKFKIFDITNSLDQKKLDKINELKNIVEEEYVTEQLDEFEYSKKYYELLTKELEILQKYEVIKKGKKFIVKSKQTEIEKSFDEKIQSLIKSEESYFKKIAKEHNIDWPKKPKKFKDLAELIEYNYKYKNAKVQVNKFITTYDAVTVDMTDNNVLVFEEDLSPELQMINLRKKYTNFEKEKELLMENIDDSFEERLKKKLKDNNFSREKLLSCINEDDLNLKLSYIEKLKNNTVPVLKFRQKPESFLKLKEILNEEAKNYRIPENTLLSDFNTKFNDPISDNEFKSIPANFQSIYEVKVKDYALPLNLKRGTINLQEEINKLKALGYTEEQIDFKKVSFLLNIKEPIKKNKKSNQSDYLERGTVISFALKPNYAKESIFIDLQNIDEKYFDIIKPLPDELYEELSEKIKENSSKNFDLMRVYELHVPIKGIKRKIIKRYQDFDDYLIDLKQILTENMYVLEQKNALQSADYLAIKINKIDEYQRKKIDSELKYEKNYSLTQRIVESEIIGKQRDLGYNKLLEYINIFYPLNEDLVNKLESYIFEYDNENYFNNIQKIIFIFQEYTDSLPNIISGDLSFIKLIGIETPTIIPENDLPDYYLDPNKTFKYLYNWRPICEQYEKYKLDLIDNNFDYIKFKKNHSELSNLEINEVFCQMHECKSWEKSLINLADIEFQKGKNPICQMLDYLKKERNKLLSRRQYKVALINDRINFRNDLVRLLNNCNLIDSINLNELSQTIESIVFIKSKRPNDYKRYKNLIIDNIKLLCEEIISEKIIIPLITEFIIKEGDIQLINIERVNNIIISDEADIELYKEFLLTVRGDELISYRAGLTAQQNNEPLYWRNKLIETINKIINKQKKEKKEFMYEIAENTYIPPILTNIIPKINTGTGFFTPKYWIINNEEHKYIYGGNFPSYYSSIDGSPNYKDIDLFNLATLLNVDYEVDIKMKELHKMCLNKLENYSDDKKIIYPLESIINYNPTLITKKTYTSKISYVYRQRPNVPEPGEIYLVYPDTFSTQYMVPFKFNEFGIPVYNSKFLDEAIKKYYYVEGPTEFEYSDNPNNFTFSSYFILIEYTDQFGKTRTFREGVNKNNIKKTVKEKFDPCGRFTNEINCNNIYSYGLNGKKCVYYKNKCISQTPFVKDELLKLMDMNINEFKFYKKSNKESIDYFKQYKFNNALEKAHNYIEQVKTIKNLNEQQIKELANEQKYKLIKYFDVLKQFQPNKKQLETILEDPGFTNNKQELLDLTDLVEEIKEVKPDKKNYIILRLPHLVYKRLKISTSYIRGNSQLVLGNRYFVNNKDVYVLIEEYKNEDGLNMLKFKNEKEEIVLDRKEVDIKSENITDTIEYTNFQISKLNYEILNNPPEMFKYRIVEKRINIKNDNIEIVKELKETRVIALDVIYKEYISYVNNYPEYLNEHNLEINSTILYNAMGELLNGVYEIEDNNFLTSLKIVNATKEAKIIAIKYQIDITVLSEKLLREVTKEDVINEYNRILPIIKTKFDYYKDRLKYIIEMLDTVKILNKLEKMDKFIEEAININEQEFQSDQLEQLIENYEVKSKEIRKKLESKTLQEEELKILQEEPKKELTKEPIKPVYMIIKKKKM